MTFSTHHGEAALDEPAPTMSPLKGSLVAFGLGALTAPLLGVIPLMGWFIGALCHEMGHTTGALLSGRPAMPRINPTGSALTTYSDPSLFLTFFVPALVGLGLWRLFAGVWRVAFLSVLGLLVIALRWNAAIPKVFFLMSGHVGEMIFATVFLWRGWTGGFTQSAGERVLYATTGFYLLGSNILLSLGLVFSASTRAWYRGPGAGACENDYVRLARDLFGWDLESVALLMVIPALAVLPVAIWLGQIALKQFASSGRPS